MKKILLTAAAVCLIATAQAQLSWGTTIGHTYYDLHSNASTGNRLVKNPDGSLSATWIEHWDFLTTINNPKPNVRGFGYNHFDPTVCDWSYGNEGECWTDPFGCGSVYTGWPELINIQGASSPNEMIIAHGNTNGVKMTSRDIIGQGVWSNTATIGIDMAEDPDGITWPRAVSSGDYIHMIGVLAGASLDLVDQYDVELNIRYYRSSDAGQTWDIQGLAFDLDDSVPTTTITSTVTITPTDSVLSIDTICTMDTIRSGSFTVGASTFNADVVFADSNLWVIDTFYTVVSWIDTSLIPDDTTAIVTSCVYDTLFYMDTVITYDTLTVMVEQKLVNRVGADRYAIHANGSTVAITLGDGGDNDWLLFKSTDNGNTWIRTIIKNNHDLPAVFIGQDGDGHLTNAGDFDIFVNNTGEVHVFAGMALTDNTYIYGDPQLYKDLDAGILYWKESMSEPKVVARPDYGFDGDTSTYSIVGVEGYGVFIQGWPAASFDNSGGIYLIYGAVAEETEFINQTTGDTIGYNDLYMVYSKDNGDTWLCSYEPISLAEDVYGQVGSTPTQDDLYPTTVPEIGNDNALHLLWQGDWARPGVALRDDTHPNDQLNYIAYAGFDVTNMSSNQCVAPEMFVCDIDGIQESVFVDLKLIPNPATESVFISSETAMSSIEVLDMIGQVVKTEVVMSSNYLLDINTLVEGIYIIRAQTAAGVAMKRLVVE